MGILETNLHLMAIENKRYPVHGKVLVLGQQAVYASVPRVMQILHLHGVNSSQQALPPNFDTKNKIPMWAGTWCGENYTNCQTVMKLLGAEKTEVCDISSYEGADLVFDLGLPVKKGLVGKYDTIVDSGTLEHIFDLLRAIENVNSMLKVGGTLILASPASKAINHGFYSISPIFYYDYLSVHGYDQITIYLVRRGENMAHSAQVYELKHDAVANSIPSVFGFSDVVVFAKKSKQAKPPRAIVQTLFANMHKKKDVSRYSELTKTARPLVQRFRGLIPNFIFSIYNALHCREYFSYVGKF